MQAIVTGSSSGIGIAIAKAFAAAGAKVACVARREKELNAVVDDIKASGNQAIAIVADVSKRGASKEIVSNVESQLGPIDVLVNNVGITRIGNLEAEDEDLDIWWRIYEVNVRAPVALIRAVLPSMVQRKSGVVMSVSSSVATLDLPTMSAYSSSKAAISKFHDSIVPELEDTGVLSFAVHPGIVESEIGVSEHAINRASMDHPAVQKFIAMITTGDQKRQTAELSADTMVALVADERCKVLNGRHINADQNLEPVVVEAEKDGMGRIGKERLYLVNIGSLSL